MGLMQLAWRYLWSRWVNAAAVLAVALCLLVQIVVMAVLDGQIMDMKYRVRNLGEQVTIRFHYRLPTAAERARLDTALSAIPGVRGTTPLISSYGILDHSRLAEPVLVYGIDLAAESRFSELPNHLLHLKLDPSNPSWKRPQEANEKRPGMFVGGRLAERLAIDAGSKVHLAFVPPGKEAMQRVPFVVSSTFISGDSFVKDAYAVFVPLAEAQRMFLRPREDGSPSDGAGVVSIWLEDPEMAGELELPIAEAARGALGSGWNFDTTTWQQRWQSIASGMEHENNLQEIIMVLMNLSGGFCVFAILATLVSRRVKDVGLLRCLGTSRIRIVGLFLTIGLVIGVAGAAMGLAGSLWLTSHIEVQQVGAPPRTAPRIDAYFEMMTGQPLYPPRMFGVLGSKGLPIRIVPWKVGAYALGAILIAVLAALYPALWAGRLEPVEALRDE